MQTGTLELEIRETGQNLTVVPGGFVLAPSRSVHRATCKGADDCYFFLHSTGPFDINIVDETGKVIKSGPNPVVARK
jgi:hypothetical protein